MIYANVSDVEARMTRTLDSDEQSLCAVLLEDAGVMIDAIAEHAADDAKRLVSCRMVARALGAGDDAALTFPVGANQGSMSALGYQQQWTLPAGGGAGELYIGKAERQLLGAGNHIGAHSPVEDLAVRHDPWHHNPTAPACADRR